MNPYYYPDTGYACGRCGQYIPVGTYHYCTPAPYLPVLERIAVALEKIAEATRTRP
jgi:hypothetical protein